MSDDNFADYQAMRAGIEKEVRTLVGGWALGEAPDAMTFQQVRTLTEKLTYLMNGATRKCWELGKANAITSKPNDQN